MKTTDVLVLQHDESEPLGSITGELHSAGLVPRFVRGFAGEEIPDDWGGAAGLIVMGGPMGVYEQDKHPWLTDELRLIRRAWEAGTPILGVCLGSQLLASALEADVAPSPHPEIGWHPVLMEKAAADDPLWAGLAPVWTGLHWHGDVHGLPAGAVRLAYSRRTPNQAFRDGPHAYGFQFHLEATAEIVHDWLGSLPAPGEGVQSREEILAGMETHLAAMQALAARVFSRWARLVTKTESGEADE
jgi:GMP synthase-like glutamine amidotransferase